MTVVGYLRERPAPALPEVRGDPAAAARTAAGDVLRRASRVPWCWPALLTLALGFYQIGRPELWRDELASWSLAARPLSGLIATARQHRRHSAGLLPAAALLDRGVRGARSTPCAACPCWPWRVPRRASRWSAASWPGPGRAWRPGWSSRWYRACHGSPRRSASTRSRSWSPPLATLLLLRALEPADRASLAGLRRGRGAARLHRPGRPVGRRRPCRGSRAALVPGP